MYELSRTLTALVVDDHPLMRSALREALAAQCAEIVEATNPEEGLERLAARPDIDVVVLDLNFSTHEGLAFISRYREAAPSAPLVIYTVHEDAQTLNQALALGAAGVIPKTHPRALLQKAISLVVEGGIYLPPLLAKTLSSRSKTSGVTLDAMTAQQRRILQQLADGAPNKEIARRLGVGPSTVKNQLTVIFQHLGVANRTQAAIAARALVASGKGK